MKAKASTWVESRQKSWKTQDSSLNIQKCFKKVSCKNREFRKLWIHLIAFFDERKKKLHWRLHYTIQNKRFLWEIWSKKGNKTSHCTIPGRKNFLIFLYLLFFPWCVESLVTESGTGNLGHLGSFPSAALIPWMSLASPFRLYSRFVLCRMWSGSKPSCLFVSGLNSEN